jgi:hypothetical protein
MAGRYLMRVGLDGNTHAEVAVQVRPAAAAPVSRTPVMMS